MPKKIFTQIKLPLVQPDRCADCPLLGTIPDEERSKDPRDRFKSLVCLGTAKALTKRYSLKEASKADSHHPHKRPCDARWSAWMQLPGQRVSVRTQDYLRYRKPYEELQQLRIDFNWR